jgi:peptidyl-prolyl cis-trans isomerase SurA
MAESTYRHWRPLAFALAACALFFALHAPSARAARTDNVQTIAAIVNDEVISDYDLEQRTRLFARAANKSDPSPEMLVQLRKQAMESLVDERLELQEAKREGIIVKEKDLDEAMQRLAQHNNMTADQMRDFFTASGVDLSTLRDQVKAQVAWNRLISHKFVPRVLISDSQVTAALQEMKRKADRPERRIAEIVLQIPSPDQDAKVRETAMRLVGEMRGGAQFATIAHEYSQAGSAALGGDVGWVAAGQLDSRIETVLDKMSPGDISEPIRLDDTYTIIGFIAQRTGEANAATGGEGAKYGLRQLVIPVDAGKPDATKAAMARADLLRSQLKSCADMTATPEAANPLSGDLGVVAEKDLPPEMRSALAGLDVNQVAPPFQGPDGVHVVMVCSKEGPKTVAEPDRRAVEEQLTDQRLDMMARRYLRDLRRDAMIEYRLAEH